MAGQILLGILGALLLMLAALLAVTAQIRAVYDQGEASLWVQYGPLKLQIYPPKPPKTEESEAPKKGKKPRTPKKEKNAEYTPEKGKLSISAEQILYALETLPPILGRALDRTRRSIRVRPLKIHLLIAGGDPAGTALLYGRAQAALAAGMPFLRQAVHIREEDIRLFLDFQRTQPDCTADIGVSMRCWTAAGIFLRAGGSLVKWILGFRKLAPPSRKKPAEEKQQNAGAA